MPGYDRQELLHSRSDGLVLVAVLLPSHAIINCRSQAGRWWYAGLSEVVNSRRSPTCRSALQKNIVGFHTPCYIQDAFTFVSDPHLIPQGACMQELLNMHPTRHRRHTAYRTRRTANLPCSVKLRVERRCQWFSTQVKGGLRPNIGAAHHAAAKHINARRPRTVRRCIRPPPPSNSTLNNTRKPHLP